MERAETYRREDRAKISDFFNGAPPLTDQEAEDMGLSINVNNLFGYTEISQSRDQLFGTYTKPTQIYSVELDACPPEVRTRWEIQATAALNELVKASGRLKPAFQGVCGDAAMHGESVFTFANPTHWCPSHTPLSRILVADDQPADTSKLTHWAVEGKLSLKEIHQHVQNKSEGWNQKSLRMALDRIYNDSNNNGTPIDFNTYNPEEAEYQRQTNSGEGVRRRPTLQVVYFYQVRCDKPGNPVDLTIVLHKNECISASGSDMKATDRVVFEAEAYFDCVEDAIHGFFMDCTIGGEPLWHRVMGTGTLNYQLNFAVEILINRAMQGTLEGMMNLWQATDSASREEIQQILLKHNGVVPENVKLIQQRFQPDLAGSLSMIQFYRQQGSKNARQTAFNTGDSNDMLEIQAMAMRDQATEATSTRMSNWYDYSDRLGKTIWSRLVNPFINSWDDGYSDILKFQSRLERHGIPLYWLQPHNVRIRATRVLGDGNSQKEQAAAMYLTQNRAMFPPKAQQKISRLATAAFTGSADLAEELVPMDDAQDQDQLLQAQTEGTNAIVQGKPPVVSDKDIDEVHVPAHFDAMVALVQKAAANGGAFTPDHSAGFQALGAHVVMHIQKRESMVGQGKNDPNKELSRNWMQQLNAIVSLGEKMQHNMEQQQQGGAKVDPSEQAKLQLEAEKLDLNRQKFEFGVKKWERQQMHKEDEGAFRRMMEMDRSKREDQVARNKMAANDVKAATTLQAANKQPAE